MIERIYPRKVVCRRRPRQWAHRALSTMLPIFGCALLALMWDAQAMRLSAASAERREVLDHSHGGVPGAVSLGQLIEMQRAKRGRLATVYDDKTPNVTAGEVHRWTAQFGAFSDLDAAKAFHAQLHAHQSVKLPQTSITEAAEVFRVQSAVLDRFNALHLCQQAEAEGIDCFVRGN